MGYSTEQEGFWAGKFGEEYTDRNKGQGLLSSAINVFSKALQHTNNINSCLEIGSNRGINLRALSLLIPEIKMEAIEINKTAADICSEIPNVNVFNGSVFDYPIEDRKFDLSFTCGVLIHIAPDRLNEVYEILYRTSRRYIMVCEYYNPTPIEVNYRGNEGKLFKRDFAGELLDKYNDLELLDYGFFYHRDNNFPKDDGTFFLLERK